MEVKMKKEAIEKPFDRKLQEELLESVQNVISRDLNTKGKVIKQYSKGTSSGIKCLMAFDKQNFFIKIGEKVARENQVYDHPLFKGNKMFLDKIDKYYIHEDVLVLPYYEGRNLDEFLFSKSTSLNEKIKTVEMVIDGVLENFWLQNVKQGSNNLDWTREYLLGRMQKLLEVGDRVRVNKKDKSIIEFFDSPIIYQKGEKTYELPSIKAMNQNVMELLNRYHPQFTTCMTADFQAPNIIINGSEFKHVDLSNSEINGDLALDIGKFFNFINRFYRVSFLRDGLKLGDAIKLNFSLEKDRVMIKASGKSNQLSFIMSQLEERYSAKVAMISKDFNIPDRVKLYKFVINSITIKRHLGYPGLTDLLFYNLIDSYTEIKDKIIRI